MLLDQSLISTEAAEIRIRPLWKVDPVGSAYAPVPTMKSRVASAPHFS